MQSKGLEEEVRGEVVELGTAISLFDLDAAEPVELLYFGGSEGAIIVCGFGAWAGNRPAHAAVVKPMLLW